MSSLLLQRHQHKKKQRLKEKRERIKLQTVARMAIFQLRLHKNKKKQKRYMMRTTSISAYFAFPHMQTNNITSDQTDFFFRFIFFVLIELYENT